MLYAVYCSDPTTSEEIPRRHILRTCAKHNDYTDFVPVRHLTIAHLPVESRSQEVLTVIRHIAQWVVRVRVKRWGGAEPSATAAVTPAYVDHSEGAAAAYTCTGVVVRVGEEDVDVCVPAHAVRNNIEVCNNLKTNGSSALLFRLTDCSLSSQIIISIVIIFLLYFCF
jgi:hypothetical protein